jgi:ceramide glucosyltransferase
VIWLAIPAIAATVYYCLVMIAAARWRPASVAAATHRWEPLSILKPIHGRDPRFYEAILSHARQDYPEFEILFGVTTPDDAALQDIERLQREFPGLRIETVIVSTGAPNAKVGVLAELARRARYSLLLVNDSDIVVEPGYLRAVTAPLTDPGVGMVTCLYRAGAESFASRFEALGIATEFAPSVLVARLLGVAEFALGSTMVFRARALEKIGGFAAIANYLADDYQLGRHIAQLGYRIEFAPMVVETHLGAGSWGQTWRHQLRWSRTIRVSRPSGYYGYVVTHATLWGMVALSAHQWQVGAAALAVRVLAGVWVGAAILGDRKVLRDFWLIPLRDLFGFGVWVAGIFGDTVQWRDRQLKLRPDGRILGDAHPGEGHPIDDGAASR